MILFLALRARPSPFVVNPAIEISKRESRIVELAGKHFPDRSDPMSILPSEVECNMDTDPEKSELCDLLTEVECLQKDPLASLLAGEPYGLP